MKAGDIVELIDESEYGGKWAGRMTVTEINRKATWSITCAHPDHEDAGSFNELELVVMEEANED